MDFPYPVHDQGSVDAFQFASQRAVESALADPRAPVVEADPSFFETVGAQWRTGTAIGALWSNQGYRTLPGGDPLTPEQVYDKLAEDGVTQYRSAFYRVRDTDSYNAVLADVQRDVQDQKLMAEAGLFKNLATGLVAGGLDPATYVPFAGPGVKLRGAAGFVQAAKSGAKAGAGGAALAQVAVLASSQTATPLDAVENIGVGGLFGLTLGVGAHAIVGQRTAARIEERVSRVVDGPVDNVVRDLQKGIETATDFPAPNPAARRWAAEILKRSAEGEDGPALPAAKTQKDVFDEAIARLRVAQNNVGDNLYAPFDAQNMMADRPLAVIGTRDGELHLTEHAQLHEDVQRGHFGGASDYARNVFEGSAFVDGKGNLSLSGSVVIPHSMPQTITPGHVQAIRRLAKESGTDTRQIYWKYVADNGGDYGRVEVHLATERFTAEELKGLGFKPFSKISEITAKHDLPGIPQDRGGGSPKSAGAAAPVPQDRIDALVEHAKANDGQLSTDQVGDFLGVDRRVAHQVREQLRQSGDIRSRPQIELTMEKARVMADQGFASIRSLRRNLGLDFDTAETIHNRLIDEGRIQVPKEITDLKNAMNEINFRRLNDIKYSPDQIALRLRIPKDQAREAFRRIHELSPMQMEKYLNYIEDNHLLSHEDAFRLAEMSSHDFEQNVGKLKKSFDEAQMEEYDWLKKYTHLTEEEAVRAVKAKPLSSGAADAGASATGVYTSTDLADARLFGVPVAGVLDKFGQAAKFLRNPRIELMRARTAVFRDELDKLDMNPWITQQDVAGEVRNQQNFHGVLRDLTAKWTSAQEDAEFIFKQNSAKYKNLDEFGKKVYAAVIQGGRSPDEDGIVERAAAGFRKYYDAVLQRFRDSNMFHEDGQVANAESYAPIVHLIDNIRNDSARFLEVHTKAFTDDIMSQWSKAVDAKRDFDAQNATITAESKAKTDEAITKLRKDYGASRGSRVGKIADERKSLQDELKVGIAQLNDAASEKIAQAKGKLQDELMTREQFASEQATIKKGLESDITNLREDFTTKIKERTDDLIKERDRKIAEAEKKHKDFLAKLEEKRPEWDRALLKRLTLERTTAEARSQDWGKELAEGYYDGATKNAVVLGSDLPNQPGLANVLKARKSKLWQQIAADNGWIETNIFRLTEHYNRRAAVDAALATVFKKVDSVTGELKGDPELRDVFRRGEADYKSLIDGARSLGDAKLEGELVAERNRMSENMQILLDMTRGKMSDPNAIGPELKKVGDLVQMYNSWRLMGGTVASSLTDPVNLAITNGLSNSLKYGVVPALENFKAAMGRVHRDELPDVFRINRLFGVVVEHQFNSRMAALADVSNPVANSKLQGWSQRINKMFWDYTGLTTWTTFWKDAAAMVTHARLIMAANEGWERQSASVKAWLTNLKIGAAELDTFAREHAAQDQKFSAGVPYGALDQWRDRAAADIFANALHRESHNVIVTPTAGDKLALQATPLGQMVWQFRTYGVASTARLIGRNAGLAALDGDNKLQLYGGIVGLTLMGTMVDAVKSALGDSTIAGQSKDGKDTPFSKYVERWQKTPGEALYNALDRSGAFWLLTEPSNVAQKVGLPNIQGAMSLALGDDKGLKSGSARFAQRGVTESVLGPTASLVEDVAKIGGFVTSATGYMVGVNPDFTGMSRGDWARMRRTIPFQNAVGPQQVLNYGHQKMGTMWDWPEPQ